jgi:hypothetical protein
LSAAVSWIAAEQLKAVLMGGSHGATLGAQIVRDYPTEIENAILFSGDTESGWLDGLPAGDT